MTYPTRRNLDGYCFRVERDGRWLSLCFTDMTPGERDLATGERPAGWWRSLAYGLADELRSIGDELDLMVWEGDGDE